MKRSTLLRKWSRLIKVRDKNTCYLCALESTAGNMEAHHIIPKSIEPERELDLDNGICLCWRCHRPIVHRGKYKDYEHCQRFEEMFEEHSRDLIWNAQNQYRLNPPS